MMNKIIFTLMMVFSFSVYGNDLTLVCSGVLSGIGLNDKSTSTEFIKKTYVFKGGKYYGAIGDTLLTNENITFNSVNKPCNSECEKIITIDRYSGVIQETYLRKNAAGLTTAYLFDGKCIHQAKRKF